MLCIQRLPNKCFYMHAVVAECRTDRQGRRFYNTPIAYGPNDRRVQRINALLTRHHVHRLDVDQTTRVHRSKFLAGKTELVPVLKHAAQLRERIHQSGCTRS